MNSKSVRPPYLGAAYYPEAWPLEQIDADVALMKKAGMNVMRMAEFAWSTMEPYEGMYDFSWLHRAVDKLGTAGIVSILGTPTATPPLWLTEKHPEILYKWDNGKEIGHGGRRHYCPNTPIYRHYVEKIVTKMAEEFGKDPRVIGWQVDNEVSYYYRPCVCPHCLHAFHQWLERKFGSIDALNRAWCTALWSQTYQRFDQVPPPRNDVWHNPALRIEWAEFGSDSYVDFISFQADVLRRGGTTQPIGTDVVNSGHIHLYELQRNLDIAQVNHYHMADNLWETAFWFDMGRTWKNRPFWNSETTTCWNGSCAANGYKEPGFCRANSWITYALGGEATLYWLWRQHYAGHELMHGAVVSSSGRPLHIFEEVAEIGECLDKSGDFLNRTRPEASGLALHFSSRAQVLFEHQPMVNNLNYPGNTLLARVVKPLMQDQWRFDVLEPGQDLSGVKLLISPFMPMLDDSGVRARLQAWIEQGGTWIAGPLTDVRNQWGAKYIDRAYGSLEQWGGFASKFEIPGDPRNFKFAFPGKEKAYSGSVWYDAMEPRGAKALARYTEGPMKGSAAIIENRMGKGRVIVLGTMPEPAAFQLLVGKIAAEVGIAAAAKASPNLLCVPRSGDGGRGMVVVELENKPATLTLAQPAKDLITGKSCAKGPVKVKPYVVMVLQYRK